MKTSYSLPLIMVIAAIITGASLFNSSPRYYLPTDVRCNWEPGACENICQSQNYFFDRDSLGCKPYVEPGISKGCCTPPPFETLEECRTACPVALESSQ